MQNFNQEPTRMVQVMQQKTKATRKQQVKNCASCGKMFSRDEKTVSYDFERYYCFHCDDEKKLRVKTW
jgi:formylmethanofuran dehydrogenase subunit E